MNKKYENSRKKSKLAKAAGKGVAQVAASAGSFVEVCCALTTCTYVSAVAKQTIKRAGTECERDRVGERGSAL